MVTIKRDEALFHLAMLLAQPVNAVADAAIQAMEDVNEYYCGYKLGQLLEEQEWSMTEYVIRFTDLLPIRTIVNRHDFEEAIGELRFFYQGAEEGCKECGYDILWDDEPDKGQLEGVCPICNTPTVKTIHEREDG